MLEGVSLPPVSLTDCVCWYDLVCALRDTKRMTELNAAEGRLADWAFCYGLTEQRGFIPDIVLQPSTFDWFLENGLDKDDTLRRTFIEEIIHARLRHLLAASHFHDFSSDFVRSKASLIFALMDDFVGMTILEGELEGLLLYMNLNRLYPGRIPPWFTSSEWRYYVSLQRK